jgi:hypothetical protein
VNEIAEEQVAAFMALLQERYGLSDEDLRFLISELLRLHRRTQFAERMGEWTAQSIIVVMVAAFFSWVGWSIMTLIKG